MPRFRGRKIISRFENPPAVGMNTVRGKTFQVLLMIRGAGLQLVARLRSRLSRFLFILNECEESFFLRSEIPPFNNKLKTTF